MNSLLSDTVLIFTLKNIHHDIYIYYFSINVAFILIEYLIHYRPYDSVSVISLSHSHTHIYIHIYIYIYDIRLY